MGVDVQIHVAVTVLPGKRSDTDVIRKWVDCRAGLDRGRKISPRRCSNRRQSSPKGVAMRTTLSHPTINTSGWD
jgi:hypothetical protein